MPHHFPSDPQMEQSLFCPKGEDEPKGLVLLSHINLGTAWQKGLGSGI